MESINIFCKSFPSGYTKYAQLRKNINIPAFKKYHLIKQVYHRNWSILKTWHTMHYVFTARIPRSSVVRIMSFRHPHFECWLDKVTSCGSLATECEHQFVICKGLYWVNESVGVDKLMRSFWGHIIGLQSRTICGRKICKHQSSKKKSPHLRKTKYSFLFKLTWWYVS